MYRSNDTTMNQFLKRAVDVRDTRNTIHPADYDLDIEDFIPHIYSECTPNTYGKVFAKKVIIDSGDVLTETKNNSDIGDCEYYDYVKKKKVYSEIKISYRNKQGNYRITNIRDFQNFDYFIICLVDTYNGFKPKFYMVPKNHITKSGFLTLTAMNNTKSSNSENKNVATSTTINEVNASWFLGKENILGGTSYKHLMKFFSGRCVANVITKDYKNFSEGNVKKRNPKTKFMFEITEHKPIEGQLFPRTLYVFGDTNIESVINLVKKLGAKNLHNLIFPAWLATTPNKYRTFEVEKGWYLYPKISLRDMNHILDNINTHYKNKLKIRIIND